MTKKICIPNHPFAKKVGKEGCGSGPAFRCHLCGGDRFVAGSKEVVAVEEDHQNDGEAAQAIDFRDVATGRGHPGEWFEQGVPEAPIGHDSLVG
jgi:hypothetical protein